jgi:hypothetical protein
MESKTGSGGALKDRRESPEKRNGEEVEARVFEWRNYPLQLEELVESADTTLRRSRYS